MKRISLILCFFIIPMTLSAANLSVAVEGLRNSEGSIILEIYRDELSFNQRQGAFKRIENIEIKDDTADVFVTLEPGKYAVMVVHDENRSGKVELGSFNQPLEGWGLAKFHRGKLKFDDVALTIEEGDISKKITVLYPQKVLFTVQGLRSTDGFLMFRVYSDRKTFLKPDGASISDNKIRITGKQVQIELMLLPGNYALNAIHDENGNGKTDRNFLGIPKEGYGNSRDAKVVFGPPKFKDAVFYVGSEPVKQKANMRY